MADAAAYAAFAHTDIQGSSRLWEKLGLRFAEILGAHNACVRAAIAAAGGRELETEGDSFTVAFPDAESAVRFALRTQEALHAHPWPAEAGELLVRIGVHAGAAVAEADPATGRPRFSGPVLARTRLVAGAAHGGQILLTAAAAEAARAALAGADVRDLGEHRLAAHDPGERLLQALPRTLAGRSFPPPRTLTARPTNILPESSRFIGRSRELEALAALLPDPAGRLVTLTGPGGIGKTRLARQAAATLVGAFEGGCWFADLSEAAGPADIAAAVAQALGLSLSKSEDPVSAVADILEYRKPLLLVMDGFEALVDHAGATVGVWARRARHVRFLVTSLTLLGLSGEREVPVPPLPTPRAGSAARPREAAEISQFDAVRLFVDRAAAAVPGFALEARNAEAVAEICADLEGIPLAIELAAARVADVPADGMLRELRSQFHTRDLSPVGGPRRRQTLQGALEWSYGLLADWLKSAFQQACVFRGGFFLEAAESVVDLSAFPDAPMAIDAVQSLRDRSLLRTQDTPLGTRFTMFRSMREFGEARLAESRPGAERRALEERHAAWYAAYAEEWRRRLTGASAAEACDRLEMDRENLCAAQDRLEATDPAGAARVCLALVDAIQWRGPFLDRLPRLERATSRPTGVPDLDVRLLAAYSDALWAAARPEEALRASARAVEIAERSQSVEARVLAWMQEGNLRMFRSEAAPAAAILGRAVTLARTSGDPSLLTRALGFLGNARKVAGEFPEALALIREALELARARDDRPALARHLVNIGNVQKDLGDSEQAIRSYTEAEAILRAVGSPLNAAKAAGNRSWALVNMGRIEEGLAGLREAIAVHRELGHKPGLAIHLNNLGTALLRLERYDEAMPLYEESAALCRELQDEEGLARAEGNIGSVFFRRGDFAAAAERFRQAAERFRQLGHRPSHALYLGNYGTSLLAVGRPREARDTVLQALALAAELGIGATVSAFNLRVNLALLEQELGNGAAAVAAAKQARELAGRLDPGLSERDPGFRRSLEDIARILDSPASP